MVTPNNFKGLRLFLIVISSLLITSCEPKRLGEEIFDLNDFPIGLSVSRLYENELKKENSESYSSSCDTSFNHDTGNKKVIAIKYVVSGDKSAKPFAKLKNINFYNLETTAGGKDNLMMFAAEADCGYADQIKLLNALKREHGKPIVKQHISYFTTFTWLLDDRTIQAHCEMIPDYENDKNKKGLFLNPDGGFLKSDSYEPNHVPKMRVYIFNNNFKKELTAQIGFVPSLNGFKPYFYDFDEKTVSPF